MTALVAPRSESAMRLAAGITAAQMEKGRPALSDGVAGMAPASALRAARIAADADRLAPSSRYMGDPL